LAPCLDIVSIVLRLADDGQLSSKWSLGSSRLSRWKFGVETPEWGALPKFDGDGGTFEQAASDASGSLSPGHLDVAPVAPGAPFELDAIFERFARTDDRKHETDLSKGLVGTMREPTIGASSIDGVDVGKRPAIVSGVVSGGAVTGLERTLGVRGRR
jgi:hypothetical protein